MEYRFHPVAELFPLLEGMEYEAFKRDVRANGLREPIWLYEEQIIDGRNRYRACNETGTEACFRTWDGNGSLVAFVVSLNLHRRHLTASQKAFVALDIEPMLADEARKRQATSTGGAHPQLRELIPQADSGRARDQAALMVGVNPHYVTDAKRIRDEAPDYETKIRSGDATITQAQRDLREEKREERRAQNRDKIAGVVGPTITFMEGSFATILIDPPWDWGDEGDINQLGRAKSDFAAMSLEELLELPVDKFADVDCHLYLWITNRSLPKGFQLIEKWGFRYITCITWCKPSYGMGNYFRGATEHLLFAVKGSQPLKRKDAATWFEAPRGKGGHSSKPAAAYDLIESCSPGPYLEMFSRTERTGWTMWGENVRAA